MNRTLNIVLVIATGVSCLFLYRIAEQARVAEDGLRTTRAAIQRETDALAVLGAEWARLTQPGRIQAMARKHLDMSQEPALQLTSLGELPLKSPPLAPEGSVRNANAEMPLEIPAPPPAARGAAHEGHPVALHAGT
jgi:hypothetical protein